MKATEIIEKIGKLPEAMLPSVSDYIDYMLEKAKKEATNFHPKKRELGNGKDLIKWIAPDFDAPLDEFKEYM
jgi:hypothetical protein